MAYRVITLNFIGYFNKLQIIQNRKLKTYQRNVRSCQKCNKNEIAKH